MDMVRLAGDHRSRGDFLAHGAKVSEGIDVGNVVEKLWALYESVLVSGPG